MLRTTLCIALTVGICSFANAQPVKLDNHVGTTDAWASLVRKGHKITFQGRVTGVLTSKRDLLSANEVLLLVRNADGGGTTTVDVGPRWFIDHQSAKIRVGDKVQVTGTKVMVSGHGMIISSFIRLRDQGGPVLTSRRLNGTAYWVATETADRSQVAASATTIDGTFADFGTYSQDNVIHSSGILQTADGRMTIDLGPQWYYQGQNLSYQIGQRVFVVSGPNPFTVGGNLTVYPSYNNYQGKQVYNLRDTNGNPIYGN